MNLIAKKTYGGIEEGGDISILRLASKDCRVLSLAIANSPHRAKDKIFEASDLSKFLKQEKIIMNDLFTSYKMNDHGDSVFYAIDNTECLLARDAYFE